MNILVRLLNRIRFRRTVKTDESNNVVDSMVKARQLYKELCVKTHPDKHPDKHPDNTELAEAIMQRVSANKFNYAVLLSLKEEIEEKLG